MAITGAVYTCATTPPCGIDPSGDGRPHGDLSYCRLLAMPDVRRPARTEEKFPRTGRFITMIQRHRLCHSYRSLANVMMLDIFTSRAARAIRLASGDFFGEKRFYDL